MSSSGFPKKSDRDTIYRFKPDLSVGEGGTGVVYRAIDPDSGAVVAIKVFRANFFKNRLHIRDLARTAIKFKKLNHINVVQIHEFIRGDEGEALVLEYVDGPDLKWYLANRPFNLAERLVIVAQICNGLGYLHDAGLMHHDLKPANVLFTRKGQVKLCDFSLCGSSYLRGLFDSGLSEQVTPMFVAPEIINKGAATKLSDMYSLGIMLYLIFSDRVPFEVDTLQMLYHAHLNTKPVHPSLVNSELPQALGDIIMGLIEKNPGKRIPNTDQLRISLSDIGRSRI